MGEAFITRRGGGIPYAVIGVTYPSGSVCTCTNGTRTMTAKDTTGKALFVIPTAGTWTVKAVSGGDVALIIVVYVDRHAAPSSSEPDITYADLTAVVGVIRKQELVAP